MAVSKDEWIALANVALIAAVAALRHGAGQLGDPARKPLDVAADYCDAIRDLKPEDIK